MSRPANPWGAPHWNRDARTRKALTHLVVEGQRVCDDRPAERRFYLRSADLRPSMPVCETCFTAWISRRNAARQRGEIVP
jgi:hypothetical protein